MAWGLLGALGAFYMKEMMGVPPWFFFFFVVVVVAAVVVVSIDTFSFS